MVGVFCDVRRVPSFISGIIGVARITKPLIDTSLSISEWERQAIRKSAIPSAAREVDEGKKLTAGVQIPHVSSPTYTIADTAERSDFVDPPFDIVDVCIRDVHEPGVSVFFRQVQDGTESNNDTMEVYQDQGTLAMKRGREGD